MLQTRVLVIKAHPNLVHPDKNRIFVKSFLIGHYDWQLAVLFDVARIQNAANAKRLSVEKKAVRHDQRSRRSKLNLLHEKEQVDDLDDSPDADLDPFIEEQKKLTAAFNSLSATVSTTHLGKQPERRKATSITMCYNCGQYWHFKSDCPKSGHSRDKRSAPRPLLI